MKRTWFIVIGVPAVIIIVAILTNPNQTKHRDAVKLTLKEMINNDSQQKSDSTSHVKNIDSSFGSLLGDMLINPMVDKTVTANNYLIFSVTQITWFGETRTIGFGVFGKVFVSRKATNLLTKTMLQIDSQDAK